MSEPFFSALIERARSLTRGEGLRARLLRGGIGSAVVQVLNRLLALGSGIVLARSLGTEGYGVYAFAFAIMSLLMIAAEAGIPTLLLREVSASQSRQQWTLLRGVLVRGLQIVVIASTSIMFIGLAGLWFAGGSLEPDRYYTLMLMLLVLPVAAAAKTVASAIKGLHRVVVGQALEQLFQPMLMLVVVAALFLGFPALREPQIAMLVQCATVLALLLASILTLDRFLPADVRGVRGDYPPRRLLASAVPFTLIGGAGIINTQADLIMLGWFRPVDEVGIYRVTSQGAMLVGFLLQAAAAVAAPHFASLYAKNDLPRIKALLTRTALIVTIGSLPVVILFVFFGAAVLELVFGAAYSGGGLALAILAIGYLINIAFGPVGMLLQMVGQERATARVLWLTAMLNLVMNAFLIPKFGTAGAATATAVSVSLYHFLLRSLIKSRLGI